MTMYDYTPFFSYIFAISFTFLLFILPCSNKNIRTSRALWYTTPFLPIGLTLLLITISSFLFACVESLKDFSSTIAVGIFCSGLLSLLIEISHNCIDNQNRIRQFEHICEPIYKYEEEKNFVAMLERLVQLAGKRSQHYNEYQKEYATDSDEWAELVTIQRMYGDIISSILKIANDMNDLLFPDENDIINEILKIHSTQDEIFNRANLDTAESNIHEIKTYCDEILQPFDENVIKLDAELKKHNTYNNS